jgi:hypothetical protein
MNRGRPDPDAALCSLGERSCGACCWSEALSRDALRPRLRRHGRLFAKHLAAGRLPGAISLLWHELRALPGADVVFGLMQWLPLLGPRLRRRIWERIVCPFAAFRGPDERQVGCLLHPSRWGGRDVRAQSALRFLPGFGCGAASYACSGAARFAVASDFDRRRFDLETASLDWYSYSAAAPRFPWRRHLLLVSDPAPRSSRCP